MGTIMAETPRVEGLARQTTRCGGDGDDGGGETVTLATSDIWPEAYLTLAVWLLFCMGDSLSWGLSTLRNWQGFLHLLHAQYNYGTRQK